MAVSTTTAREMHGEFTGIANILFLHRVTTTHTCPREGGGERLHKQRRRRRQQFQPTRQQGEPWAPLHFKR